MAQDASVQSVVRALQLLGAFRDGPRELGVAQLAGFLGVHVSTASRLAATLAAHGFLERSRRGSAFRLGPELARLGLIAAGGNSLVETAREAMDELAGETGETVVLSVPSGNEAVDVAQVDSRYLVGGQSWVGRRLPLHATSDGKVFLTFGAATLEAKRRLERVTPRTVTDRAELARELADVRACGWATAVGECEEGLNGVAAPVFHTGNRCVAALSVSGPSYRLPAELLPELGRRCASAAARVSARLGSEPGPLELTSTQQNGGSP
ncbi:MAG: IclR family transcriptional regulator [Actinomycetota bacterium]|nr:IclR family transcriptional regulator [Actinomycetota bacterium]